MTIAHPLSITGIIMLIVGMIFIVISIIILISEQNKPKSAIIWVLMIIGLVMGTTGGVLLAIGLEKKDLKPLKPE